MGAAPIEQQFTAALAAVIEQVKGDRTILAAVLCGSLSHDTVWAKSDIDLVLVTIDDSKVPASDKSLYADGVKPRAGSARRVPEMVRRLRPEFLRAFVPHQGRLLYARSTIADLCAPLAGIGERVRGAAAAVRHHALLALQGAQVLLTRRDLDYTALWILYAATPLARVEVIRRRLLADREVIPQALALNRAFFTTIYTDLLNSKKSRKAVENALEAAEGYLARDAATLFGPVIDYLRDAGEARSSSEIDDYFKRNLNVECVSTACEYLADQGIIGKASTPARLTKKSNIQVQELAFFTMSHEP